MLNKVSDIFNFKDKNDRKKEFSNIIKNIQYPANLQVMEEDMNFQRIGREQALIKISKETWIGDSYTINDEGKPILTNKTFHIHFEPTLITGKNAISLPFHYEVFPYLPLRNKDKEQDIEGYLEYDKRRLEIISYVHKKLKLTNESSILLKATNENQMLKIELKNLDISIGEFANIIYRLVNMIARYIDEALANV